MLFRSLHLHLQLLDSLHLISQVKVNPSLPLKEFRRSAILSSSDPVLPLNVTFFLYFHNGIAVISRLAPAALLVFLAAAAGTGVVGIDLDIGPLRGRLGQGVVLVGTGDFPHLLTLHFLLHLNVEQNPDGLFLDVLGHLVEHAVAAHLVLHQGIPLTVGLEADALAQLL